MRALSLLAVLVVLTALAYGSEVYVFKVWLPQPYSGFGIYVPGVKWGLGEAAWIFMAPVERGEAVYALTGNITEVKLYDARAVYIAIPATKPARVAKADAWLETPVGKYPVRIGKPHGLTLTLVDSEEEIFEVLREAGYSPKYMGEAKLVRDKSKLPEPFEPEEDEAPPEPDKDKEPLGPEEGEHPEPLRPEPLTTPSTGSTYRVYGGVYFVPARVTAPTTVVIKPHAQSRLQVCSNVPDVAFVGYDAEEMTLGVYILGGTVRGRLVVEVYAIEGTVREAPCSFLGRWEAGLVNRTYYTVPYVNASASSAKPLAVKVYVRADSVAGSPRVSINASVAYSRTYRYGLEMSEYMTHTRGRISTAINQYVSRVVFGPYLIPDGIASGRHEVRFAIGTEPVSGTCPPIYAEWLINGVWAGGRIFNSTGRTPAGCGYIITFTQNRLETTGLWFAKPFAGAYYYVVRLRYSGGGLPYVKTIEVLGHEALRGWRWAEVWRSVPTQFNKPPLIWKEPFTASEVQVLYTTHAQLSSATAGQMALVHGVFSFRNTGSPPMSFFQVTVAGSQFVGGRKYPVSSFSITMRFSMDISGRETRIVETLYATPAGVEEIKEPIWVFYAKLAKTAVDFGVAFIGLGPLGSLLYQGLSFAVDRGLESAVTRPTLTIIDSYTLRISWTRGWADNHPSDKVHVSVAIPEGKMLTTTPTTVTVRELKLEYVTYTPNLQWYIQPKAGGAYDDALRNPPYKIWMLGGLTDMSAIYRIN